MMLVVVLMMVVVMMFAAAHDGNDAFDHTDCAVAGLSHFQKGSAVGMNECMNNMFQYESCCSVV